MEVFWLVPLNKPNRRMFVRICDENVVLSGGGVAVMVSAGMMSGRGGGGGGAASWVAPPQATTASRDATRVRALTGRALPPFPVPVFVLLLHDAA